MKSLHDENLHARVKFEKNLTGIQFMNEEQVRDSDLFMQDDLLDDASILFPDFPPPLDFHYMSSSSSSSSSTPEAAKAIVTSSVAAAMASSSSSSSAASWAVLMSDGEEDVDKNHHHHERQQFQQHPFQHLVAGTSPPVLSSTASMDFTKAAADSSIDGFDCMDVMENFEFMDLLDDSNDVFDPSSIFNQEEQEQQPPPQNEHHQELVMDLQSNNGNSNEDGASDDLAKMFFEWLKSNKETVSAEDLRGVKIKKSTIEFAAKRLGGGKEAMKQLLKLILEWVQINHLHNKRRMREPVPSSNNLLPLQQYQVPFTNPNPNLNCNPIPTTEPNPCLAQSSWIGQQPYFPDTATVMGFSPAVGYMGDSFPNNGASNVIGGHGYATPPPSEYHMLETAQSWPQPQFSLASHYNSFPENNFHPGPVHPQAFIGYGNQYPYPFLHGHEEQRLTRMGSSATKEARKKRMARQRRLSSHLRHHHHNHHNQQNQLQNQSADQHASFGCDNFNHPGSQGNAGSWVFWPNTDGGPAAVSPPALHVDRRPPMQTPNHQQRQTALERRQGWKPEKNLRFLLQKVLKQSDVGNLGRIVLPKKEAETHLPELEARDGISIAMEDIGTSRVWNMRYRSIRFWPNNKSRMYLLENTGDFVKANGLQEGDFIVIYSDVKCGKYLIRGVKVRQQGQKSETKRPGKSQRNQQANSPSAAPATASSSGTSK